MTDVRDILFREIAEKKFRTVLKAERSGVFCGRAAAITCARTLGIEMELCKKDGDELSHGQWFANFLASPKQVALAEEKLIGTIAKACGIATAARTAVQLADGKAKIVSGAWKKMPPETKEMVRGAIAAGGAAFRICERPMMYLDKNFIRMLGGIQAALAACRDIPGTVKVIQIKGISGNVEEETRQALQGGAGIFMVDTGRLEDLRRCRAVLEDSGRRGEVQLAYAGGVKLTDIPQLTQERLDVLCIGKQIVDARLLDMKLDVIREGLSWD